MKCSNCFGDIISIFHCRDCLQNLCSIPCFERHFLNFHQEKNILLSQAQANSPYLINGFLNNSITYNSFFSLKNFVPIFDEYGKIKIIGSGSYGQVYLAQHTIDNKYYAIKHMDKKKLYSLLHSLSSIQKEIDIQSKIEHPNIVKLLFVKETNISYDLIMEYASDGSLFHYIRKYKGLNENKSFSLFIQVVNAINFLHQNDLIHRDIKPENILMFDNNVVKLCDFGWCVKLDGHQRGTFCGTTEYMSPELVNHEGYGKEIDVWSLGVLLYEMIHGYSPFRPNKPKFNEKDVMENIKNHNLIFSKKVSCECKELIYHLLDPNINNRYKVEDIYNSKFVKKYELMHYDFPNNNLVLYYNQNLNQNNIINLNKNKENINTENIIYQEISPQIVIDNKNNNIQNSFDSLIYSLNNNNKIQNYNNIYNNYQNNNKTRNISSSSLNRSMYSEYITFINNNEPLYNENFNNYYNDNNNNNINDEINNIKLIVDNNNGNQRNIENKIVSNKTADNFYPTKLEKNREKEIIDIYHAYNNEKVPQDSKRDNKEFINFNNNELLFLTGQNQNITDNKINQINQINQINNIWDNTNNINNINNINNTNNINQKLTQIDNISNTQYVQIEQPQNINNDYSNEDLINKLISNTNKYSNIQNIDNNVNYNYYYNFNNYNNNFTNNFFNNSYNSLSNQITKKNPLVDINNDNNPVNAINLNINYKNSVNNINSINNNNSVNNNNNSVNNNNNSVNNNNNSIHNNNNSIHNNNNSINNNNNSLIYNNNSFINNNNSFINNNNCLINKNKTPSTIPTTSNKNILDTKNININIKENIIQNNNNNKNSKISEFEIGEENYNLSEKEQNEYDFSSIKININKDSQKINNRKYLSKSDYSIFNKKQKDLQNNKNNNKDIKEKKIENINNFVNNFKNNSANNVSILNNPNEEIVNLKKQSIQKKISTIELKNENPLEKEEINIRHRTILNNNLNNKKEKIKILDENNDNIKIHEIKIAKKNIPLPKNKKEIGQSPKSIDKNMNNIIIKQTQSKSYCEHNDNNILVEIHNLNNKNINNDNNKDIENKNKVIEKINKEKKEYLKVLKEGNPNNKNKILVRKEDNNNNNFIEDILCSIFHAFNSKKDQKNEINILKKKNNYNKNTGHVMKNNLFNNEILNPKYDNLKTRNNSFIKINFSQNSQKNINKINRVNNYKKDLNNNNYNKNKGFIPNRNKSPFIKINNNNNNHSNPEILNLGNSHLGNSRSASNINKYSKKNNIINSQPNSNNKFNDYHEKILKPSISFNNKDINNEKRNININHNFENNNVIIKEIPIIEKEKNVIKKKESNKEDYSNLGDSKIITPKKRYIFNRVNPIKLLGAFKKELNNLSKKESKTKKNHKFI